MAPLFGSFLLAAVIAHPQVSECPSTSGPVYCAILSIRDGLTVRGPSMLAGSQPLPAGGQKTLDDYLDSALKAMGKPYRMTLTPDEQRADDTGELDDGAGVLSKLREFDGSFEEYFEALSTWCEREKGCESQPDVILSVFGLYRAFTRYQDAPLLFDQESDVLDFASGLVVFRVPPPFDLEDIDLTIPALSPPVEQRRRREIEQRLAPLNGSLWKRDVVIERIKEFYDDLGYDPDVRVSFDGPRPSISILEGSTIRSLAFPLGLPVRGRETDWVRTERAIYSLLRDKDFRNGYLPRRREIRDRLDARLAPALDYVQDLRIDFQDAPLLSRLRLPMQQLLVQQNGFALTVGSAIRTSVKVQDHDGGPERQVEFSLVDLRLEALEQHPPKTENKVVPAQASASGRVEPHLSGSRPDLSTSDRVVPRTFPDSELCEADSGTLREKTGYLGFEIRYLPDQGLRTYGLVQESADLSVMTVSGSVRAGMGGGKVPLTTGNFAADYVFFERLHRRLAIEVSGGIDSQAQRLLQGQNLNEYRRGGMARAELEWFRDRDGHLLKFHAEGHQETVTHKVHDAEVNKSNLRAFDLGLVHMFQSVDNPYPWTFRLEPKIRIAPSADSGFKRFAMTGKLHRALPRQWAFDFSGRYEHASANTPEFELPSMGGPETVRAVRRDDALGQRLWSVQPEVWMPVPFVASRAIRKIVKMAAFLDSGAVYRRGETSPAFRSSIGIGGRLIYGPLVLKLDSAFRISQSTAGTGRFKMYFTVFTNLPI